MKARDDRDRGGNAMQIHQDYDHTRYTIRAYEDRALTVIAPLDLPPDADPGTVRRAQQARLHCVGEPVVVTPERLITGWMNGDIMDLRADHLEALCAVEMEVLILGTGPRQVFPHPRHLAPLMERGIGVEVMDTAAACRTYNFLISDGRRAAAALLL